MNKEKLLELLKDKKIQNYSYHIFFFLAFSFFIIFAIQPNLSTAFRLQKELQGLRLQNKKSEEVILQIVNYQSLMEEYRDSLSVLDEAVPSTPELAKVVDEISKTASDSGLVVKSLTIESIDLKGSSGSDPGLNMGGSIENISQDVANAIENEVITGDGMTENSAGSGSETGNSSKKPDLLSFTITIEGTASISQITQFLNQLIEQRRLKTYDSISLSTDSSNEDMVINLLIRTYYL